MCIDEKFNTETWNNSTAQTGTGTDGSVCPANWRMPTAQEFADLIGYTGEIKGSPHYGTVGYNNGRELTLNEVAGFAFDGTSGALFFPFAGQIYNGNLQSGSFARYWLITERSVSANSVYSLGFNSGVSYGMLWLTSKSNACPIRCVKSAS